MNKYIIIKDISSKSEDISIITKEFWETILKETNFIWTEVVYIDDDTHNLDYLIKEDYLLARKLLKVVWEDIEPIESWTLEIDTRAFELQKLTSKILEKEIADNLYYNIIEELQPIVSQEDKKDMLKLLIKDLQNYINFNQ
jgi:hypothetical protein